MKIPKLRTQTVFNIYEVGTVTFDQMSLGRIAFVLHRLSSPQF